MSVRPFDRTVLVREPGIVAGRRHAVMRAQRLIALRQILCRIPLQIAERRREAVAAVLQRCATQGPQGVLQALGQGHETLAAEHHAGMLPAGERQAEVVEPMIERHAGDGDAKRRGIGEIRQALLTRRMLLAEDHLALRAMQRLPQADPPLQRAAQIIGEPAWRRCISRSTVIGRRPGTGQQHRHDLAAPNTLPADRDADARAASASGRAFGDRHRAAHRCWC